MQKNCLTLPNTMPATGPALMPNCKEKELASIFCGRSHCVSPAEHLVGFQHAPRAFENREGFQTLLFRRRGCPARACRRTMQYRAHCSAERCRSLTSCHTRHQKWKEIDDRLKPGHLYTAIKFQKKLIHEVEARHVDHGQWHFVQHNCAAGDELGLLVGHRHIFEHVWGDQRVQKSPCFFAGEENFLRYRKLLSCPR